MNIFAVHIPLFGLTIAVAGNAAFYCMPISGPLCSGPGCGGTVAPDDQPLDETGRKCINLFLIALHYSNSY